MKTNQVLLSFESSIFQFNGVYTRYYLPVCKIRRVSCEKCRDIEGFLEMFNSPKDHALFRLINYQVIARLSVFNSQPVIWIVCDTHPELFHRKPRWLLCCLLLTWIVFSMAHANIIRDIWCLHDLIVLLNKLVRKLTNCYEGRMWSSYDVTLPIYEDWNLIRKSRWLSAGNVEHVTSPDARIKVARCVIKKQSSTAVHELVGTKSLAKSSKRKKKKLITGGVMFVNSR